jgi:hypothetical protein
MFRTTPFLFAMTLAGACIQTPAGLSTAGIDSAGRAIDGTPEAMGMLAFLNDESTTYDLLDIDVGLDRRAARSITDWRNGIDRTFGTVDDRPFKSIDTVDNRYYVGPSALGKIEAWAFDHGWVPTEGDDLLGIWDGVSFTVDEAVAVVALANTAGWSYLDDDLALDARAVDSIVAARPLSSIHELAELYYVGAGALTALKDDAVGPESCDTPGWDIAYVYAGETEAWRSELPSELVAVIDDTLMRDDWCDEGVGQPWFVKATVDRFNCDAKGYTIELGQPMAAYAGVTWYIEFEVDDAFNWFLSTCEV